MSRRVPRVDLRLGAEWVRPHWMERQLDPRSPAFVPNGPTDAVANITHRNWTVIGTVGSSCKGIVDPRGLVTPSSNGWSLDWWILGEDRWHFPSREAAVRQQLLDDTPVVETSVRIKGGDAVQRVFAVSAPQPVAVVEITNRAPTPIAIALSVRPYNPVGLAAIDSIRLHDRTVVVNGRPGLLLPKRPQGLAVSTFTHGDVVAQVEAEDTAGAFPEDVRCEAGLATAAFVYSLAHTASLRVALPLDARKPAPRRRGARSHVEPAPARAEEVPSGDAVARGWLAQTADRGVRLVVPEGALASAIEANRRFLLLFHEGAGVTSDPFSSHESTPTEAAGVLVALDRIGFHSESAEVLNDLPNRQRSDGSFGERNGAGDGTGAALYAMAEHWRLSGSLDDLDAATVARGARWIERAQPRSLAGRRWSLRSLLDAADLLRAFGDEQTATECEHVADGLRAHVDATLAHPEPDPVTVGPAVFQSAGDTGLSPSATLRLAEVELALADPRALERLAWMLEVASDTFTWPDMIHPNLGRGCMGAGHSGHVAGEFVGFVRNLLVRESGPNALALTSMLPESWRGQNLEVHNAPTHFGNVSFAVRWHDDRPALLWDRTARQGEPPVRITALGLDPSWSSDLPKGEALLAPAPGVRLRAEAAGATADPIEGSFS